MTRLLMLDTDARLVASVARALASHQVAVLAAPNLERALELAKSEPFALLIIDSNLVSVDDLGLFSGTPIVTTASFLEPEPARRFFGHGRVLRKPFTSAELSQLLSEELGLSNCRESLLDILSHGHLAKKSFCLRVGSGELVLENGELIHAERAGVSGEAALVAILAKGDAVVRAGTSTSSPRTIARPFRPVLLEALRLLEERERGAAS
jgi:CheY-like chemotaxis protein